MLRTAIAVTAAVVAIGLVGAPSATAACGLHGKYGTYDTACLDKDPDQAIKDIHRVQRFEMGRKVAEKVLSKIKPGYRPNFPTPHGIVKPKPKPKPDN
ncbi:hypothetical protein ABFW14_30530 [Mycolicibacterium fortuitum]|uniref:hypothetical protein n=1 Tax=Mycolicibacterium fortuitum TaxID=1766 RepID=UPI0007ECE258|nr:hypothetical protein [Mycolicibacterium fortuitum]OBK04015.1 hypothetical protein A5637_13105 [Mycolicibacterium fortuitum]